MYNRVHCYFSKSYLFRHNSCLKVPSRTLASTSALQQNNSLGKNDGNLALPAEQTAQESQRRRRRTEWKRRQRGQSFLDHLVINVRGGRGGDGCAAFHREKFKPFGPPSGGNGGAGGSVYISPSAHLTSLAGIPKRIIAAAGTNGQGTWQHGRSGTDVTIHVPFGTIVREVLDSRRAKDSWEAEEESYNDMGLTVEERRDKRRERRWLHYPQYEENNVGRDAFREAEARLASEERERRAEELERRRNPLVLEFEGPEDESEEQRQAKEREEINRPLGIAGAKMKQKGALAASGGSGGVGNPFFLSKTNRSPKFATRGQEGTRVTLELVLKLVADVGLVGFPNAGKSTLLNALTKRRAEVAAYAFTTLNPQVGIVRVMEDGSFDGGGVVEESWLDREREREGLGVGIEEGSRRPRDGRGKDEEIFRFTIADNPGLIANASENVGLGHSFLRSIERARALAYVVDLSGERPWDELDVLRHELENYKNGLSTKCRLVIANKADLIGSQDNDMAQGGTEHGDEDGVREAKAKLAFLEGWVHKNLGPLDVVPVSAKYSQNLQRIVRLLRIYVDESRRAGSMESPPVHDTVDWTAGDKATQKGSISYLDTVLKSLRV